MNESSIRRVTNERFFSRGKSLYRGRSVFDMDVMKLGDETHVETSVMGDSGTEYTTGFILEDDEIVDYWCTCPAANQYDAMCKHGVAAALEYLRTHPARTPLEKRGIRLNQKKETSYVIKEALYKAAMEQQAQFLQGKVTGNVELIPILRKSFHGWEIEFKIGIDRKYVLKDLYAFAQAMEQREKVHYGKQLSFIHEKSAFTQKSAVLADFITQCVRAREGLSEAERSGYLYISSSGKTRTLPLTKDELASFLDLLDGAAACQLENSSNGKKGMLEIKDQDPRLKVALTKDSDDGYLLKFPSFYAICGEKQMYVLLKNTAYRCSPGFRQSMETLCASMGEKTDYPYYIAQRDMNVFCTSLYPGLIQYTNFQSDEDLSQYMPETCTIHIYLDKEDGLVTCRLESIYGEKKHNPIAALSAADLYRDLAAEQRAVEIAKAYFPESQGQEFLWFDETQEDRMYQLLSTGIQQLARTGEVYLSQAINKISIQKSPAAGIQIDLKGGLLDLQILSDQLPYEELEGLLASYRMRKKYHRLKDGNFMMLEDSSLEAISELTEGLDLSEKALKTGSIQVPRFRSFYVDQVLKDSRGLSINRSSAYKELVRSMKAVEDSDFQVPDILEKTLRNYQKEGYQWLMTLEALGFGGVLADDMGLGKSVQMLAFLWQKAVQEKGKPSLLVCPASLVYNWREEVEKFVPQLKTAIIAGTAAEREEQLSQWEHFDLLITSYDLLKRDIELYEGKEFYCQILDEAQNIKNQRTQAAKAAKAIRAQVRFALTGTPIENRLSELWSIFDFLMPGLLGSYASFRTKYEKAIVQDQDDIAAKRLQRMIKPFLLRRLKEDVLKDLPDKWETVVYAEMEGEQKDLYSANAQKLLAAIKSSGSDAFGKEKLKILAGLTRLRQLCCDPHLLYENYTGSSAKLDTCMELVRTAVSSGHKVLLFSQFTSMLAILQEKLKQEDILCHILTGSTSKEQRAELVKAYNQDEVPVFLISLKAGGTGLNLTAASIVIHFDPWWNLAAQNQATDRAYRIGQEKEVTVYKLIARDTIEEKIQKLQEQKAQLSQQIITKESMAISALTREEFAELLK